MPPFQNTFPAHSCSRNALTGQTSTLLVRSKIYENSEYNSENYKKIRNTIPKNCIFRRIIVADYVRNNAKNYIFLHEIM